MYWKRLLDLYSVRILCYTSRPSSFDLNQVSRLRKITMIQCNAGQLDLLKLGADGDSVTGHAGLETPTPVVSA